MDADILNCCTQLKEGQTCNYNLYFQKDIYDPHYYDVPAILMIVVSVLSLFVLFFGLRNIVKIFDARSDSGVRNVLIMNTFVGCAAISLFIYSLDAPIQLFSYSGGFNPKAIMTLQVVSVCFFHYTLAYASFTWAKLICMYKSIWGDNLLTKFIQGFLALDIAYITLMMVVNVVFSFVNTGDSVSISLLGLSISTFVNGVVFSISCYTLATHLREIYDFDSRKQTKVKMLRSFALIIAVLVLCRVANDLYSYFNQDWQMNFKVTTFCNENPAGGLYLFFYILLVNILPQTLFLMIFSPTTHQKSKSGLQNDWQDYESDQDTPEGTTHK